MLERGEELAGTGSWDWDIGGGEVRWSANLFRLFGLAPGEITPSVEYVLERTHPDDRDRVRRVLGATTATGRREPLEYRIVRVDGGVRFLQSVVSAVGAGRGAPRRLVGVVQDVTEPRRLAREVAGHIAIEEVMARWVSLDESGDLLLAALGMAMDFSAGVLTLRRDGGLDARSCWNSLPQDLGELETLKRPVEEGEGHALAVEAWLCRRPVVIVSLADAQPFPGRDLALALGLRSAVAVPAVSGDQTLAALEFYAREALEPSETLVRTLTGMGHELGHFFALRRGELRPHSLTPREREVLELTAQGLSGKVIAQRLALSQSTVKTHFENIYSKWGVSDRASAVAKALREGLIQ
jgi:PAS domain S-box-containing protein